MSTAMRAFYYENTGRLGKCHFGAAVNYTRFSVPSQRGVVRPKVNASPLTCRPPQRGVCKCRIAEFQAEFLAARSGEISSF